MVISKSTKITLGFISLDKDVNKNAMEMSAKLFRKTYPNLQKIVVSGKEITRVFEMGKLK